MSRNKKTFNLSREVKEAMEAAYKSARKIKSKDISLDNFLFNLLVPILEERKECHDKSVKEFLGRLKEKEKDSIIAALKEEFEEASEDKETDGLEEFIDHESIAMDEDFEIIFNEAQAWTNKVFPERLERIETDVLLYCALRHDEIPVVYAIIACGLDPEILEKIITDGRAKTDDEEFSETLTNLVSSITGIDKEDARKISKAVEKAVDEAEGILKEKRIEPKDDQIPIDQMNEDDKNFEKYGDSKAFSGTEVDPNSDTPILDSFAVDYTRKASKGEFDPVIGRDEIVDSIIEVLTKRKKNSVVITGPAGGGKSAVVERLAQRIVRGEVPKKMQGIRLCALNINDLIAGTQYRGQFEERIQKIIKEVIEHKGEIIIFIDELHNIVNAGSSGTGDMANILKPYLARGEFQCIGATTDEEYHRYIEKDAALNRRFTQIEVLEPTAEETLKILKGIQGQYERFHRVRYSKEALESCVEWAGRYISDKNFPDKAIDALDMSGSLVSLRKIEEKKVNSELEDKLADVIQRKIKAVTEDCDYELGENLKAEEEKLRSELEKEEKAGEKVANNKKNWPEVTTEDIAVAISKLSRIPVDKINETDRDKIAKMKRELEKRVIGQQEAIDTFVQAIQLNSLGLRDERKPICSVLAVGPSGVGKTLISQEVANIFFGSDHYLVKIDGGEFKEEHSLSKLIGAPAGYIGYEESSNALFYQVAQRKRVVCLFDEIEKFNPKILDVILSITDQGYCKMANGMRVDFTNSILVFTGNIGTKELKNSLSIGFGNMTDDDKKKKDKSIVMKSIEKHFRPEFINRLSSIVVFNSLTEKDMEKIFMLELDKLKKNLNKSKISIKVSNKLRNFIIENVDKNFGARDLQRGITKYVVSPVSNAMLENTEATKFNVDLDEEKKESVVSI